MLVMQDYFSNWLYTISLLGQNTDTIVQIPNLQSSCVYNGIIMPLFTIIDYKTTNFSCFFNSSYQNERISVSYQYS